MRINEAKVKIAEKLNSEMEVKMNSLKVSVKKDCKDDTDELMLIYQTMSSCRDQVRIVENNYKDKLNKLSKDTKVG